MTLSFLFLLSPTQGFLSEAHSILANSIAVLCASGISLSTMVTLYLTVKSHTTGSNQAC